MENQRKIQELEIIKQEIKEAMAAGTPVVNMSIFDNLDKLTVNDNIIGRIEYTQELYMEFIEKLRKLSPELQSAFLKQLKNADIIDNQSLEKEDSFIISLYRSISSTSAIDMMIEQYGKNMLKEKFIQMHDQLLQGTSSSDKKGLRTDNTKFVGKFVNGERRILYFPILDTEVELALEKFLNYYNANINNISKEYDVFIKPFVYHGLIAALQLFNDGNTRLARIFQNVEMWGMINQTLEKSLELPIVYATRQYFSFRADYRYLIEKLAVNHEMEDWNNWFKFNLSRVQDGLCYGEEKLAELQKIKCF